MMNRFYIYTVVCPPQAEKNYDPGCYFFSEALIFGRFKCHLLGFRLSPLIHHCRLSPLIFPGFWLKSAIFRKGGRGVEGGSGR